MTVDEAQELPRTLSSATTFFSKVVFPAALLAFLAYLAVLIAHSHGKMAAFLPLIAAFFLFGPLALMYQRLKRVRMDADSLYISNYVTEIAVPLSDVTEVSEIKRLRNKRAVAITFCSPTRFGPQIEFSPTVRFTPRSEPHPVVAEIRQAVARANHARPEPARRTGGTPGPTP